MDEQREPFSNAEFCRFVAEAKEQRARADAAEVALRNERQYRDVAEFEAAEYRAALEANEAYRKAIRDLPLEDGESVDAWVEVANTAGARAERMIRVLLATDPPRRGAALLAAGERMAVVIERVLGTVTETGEPDWPAGEDAVTTWRALRVRGTGDTSG